MHRDNFFIYRAIQVWNAYSGLPIANYRGHSEKLLCCAFSSIDSNVVFSGGEDYCLLRWRIDAQTNTTPPNECNLNQIACLL